MEEMDAAATICQDDYRMGMIMVQRGFALTLSRYARTCPHSAPSGSDFITEQGELWETCQIEVCGWDGRFSSLHLRYAALRSERSHSFVTSVLNCFMKTQAAQCESSRKLEFFLPTASTVSPPIDTAHLYH